MTRRRRSSTSTSQKVTRSLTQARITRGRTGRRKGASRRSSTTTAMPPLLHQGTTATKIPHRKRKRLIKNILLIILVSLTIQMHICCLFHLENLLTFMEKTICFGVIKRVVIYFLSILVFGKLWKTECILTAVIIPYLLMSKLIRMPRLLQCY
jgi:hypothetical protein